MLPTRRNRGSAFGTLADMSREMDRLMNTVWTEERNATNWGLPAEVLESDDEIQFNIEAPGFRIEDIDITLVNNVLTISGEKKFEQEDRPETEVRLFERRYGRFQRSFTVPPSVRGEQCQARYEHGVLTVRLPKTEEARPRRIQIETGDTEREGSQRVVQNGSQRTPQNVG